MDALLQRFRYTCAAQAVLGHRGGVGAGAIQLAAGGVAFTLEGGDEHAGAEQRDPFAPQPGPGATCSPATTRSSVTAATAASRRSPAPSATRPDASSATTPTAHTAESEHASNTSSPASRTAKYCASAADEVRPSTTASTSSPDPGTSKPTSNYGSALSWLGDPMSGNRWARSNYQSPLLFASLSRRLFGRISGQFCSM
jgi:hypothetical protein